MRQKQWYLLPGEALGTVKPTEVPGPSGPGYVVQVTGYHFHNRPTPDDPLLGAQYVRETFMANLHDNRVILPYRDENGKIQEEVVTLAEMGIGYPALVDPKRPEVIEIQDPNVEGAPSAGGGFRARRSGGGGDDDDDDYSGDDDDGGGGGGGFAVARPGQMVVNQEPLVNPVIQLGRFDFQVQFVWQPTPPSVRHERRAAAQAAEGQPPEAADAAEPAADAAPAAEPTG
jgi:type IV pilus assembly protein PilM